MEQNKANKEPDFRTQKGEWLVWNMLTYNNDIQKASELLKQKEIVSNILRMVE